MRWGVYLPRMILMIQAGGSFAGVSSNANLSREHNRAQCGCACVSGHANVGLCCARLIARELQRLASAWSVLFGLESFFFNLHLHWSEIFQEKINHAMLWFIFDCDEL